MLPLKQSYDRHRIIKNLNLDEVIKMTEKLQLRENKTLKISNALIYEAALNEKFDFDRVVHMMQSYIKSHGLQTRGPLITSSSISQNTLSGQPQINTSIIFQLTEPITSCETPYIFKPLIKVGPCLFVRFTGDPQDLQYANMKLSVYSFENGIKSDGSSYTVFVNQNENNMTADAFMPIKQEVK